MSLGNVVHPAYDNDKVLVRLCFQTVRLSAHTVRVGGTFISDKIPLDQFVYQCGYSGFAEMGPSGKLCAGYSVLNIYGGVQVFHIGVLDYLLCQKFRMLTSFVDLIVKWYY